MAGVFLRLVVGVALSATTAIAADYSQDIAIIDRALASGKPGEPWVKFGDVGIKYADLQQYRDRLEEAQSAAPRPLVVTPGDTSFMQDQMSGTGVSLQLVDPSAVGVTKRFYRLSIEP